MDWQCTIIPGHAPDGKSILSVLAKRTYHLIPGQIKPIKNQFTLNNSEILSDPANPFNSEVLTESDLVAYKQKTDVVVNSKVYAPKGKKAINLVCEISIGTIQKKMRVFGNRNITSSLIKGLRYTDPLPFEQQQTGWTQTYGGMAKSKDGIIYCFPPNPIGKGFYLKKGFRDYSEIIVPCCEDPDHPVEPHDLILQKFENWKKAPKPVSFGWTKPGFFPRFTYAGMPPGFPGAFDSGYKVNPSLPKLDFRFFQGAADGLGDYLLNGDEHVKLTFMDPLKPIFEFDLPNSKPSIAITIDNQIFEPDPVLQTVYIDKENDYLFMVWRGSILYDRANLIENGLPKFRVI